jgi:hypothetical protein
MIPPTSTIPTPQAEHMVKRDGRGISIASGGGTGDVTTTSAHLVARNDGTCTASPGRARVSPGFPPDEAQSWACGSSSRTCGRLLPQPVQLQTRNVAELLP